jgi:hypothetical protein
MSLEYKESAYLRFIGIEDDPGHQKRGKKKSQKWKEIKIFLKNKLKKAKRNQKEFIIIIIIIYIYIKDHQF